MMKLATRNEGQWIYKAIEYKRDNQAKFIGLVEAIAADLKVPTGNVLKVINNIERRM